jgi:predicted GNAT family acetyltransferase
MSEQVEHDRAGQRFVVRVDGEETYVKYRESEGVVDFVSTFTPPALRGRGLARRVVDAGLAWARGEGKGVRGSCWYVDKVLSEEGAG